MEVLQIKEASEGNLAVHSTVGEVHVDQEVDDESDRCELEWEEDEPGCPGRDPWLPAAEEAAERRSPDGTHSAEILQASCQQSVMETRDLSVKVLPMISIVKLTKATMANMTTRSCRRETRGMVAGDRRVYDR